MPAKPAEGAWHGRSPEHFTTRGADCFLGEGGWYARCNRRVRGPLSCLTVAMEVADKMLDDEKRATG